MLQIFYYFASHKTLKLSCQFMIFFHPNNKLFCSHSSCFIRAHLVWRGNDIVTATANHALPLPPNAENTFKNSGYFKNFKPKDDEIAVKMALNISNLILIFQHLTIYQKLFYLPVMK